MNNFAFLLELIYLAFFIIRCDSVITDIKPLLMPSIQRIPTENEFTLNTESSESLGGYTDYPNVVSTFFSSIAEYYREVSNFFQTNTDLIFRMFQKIYATITNSFRVNDIFSKLFTLYGGSLTNPTCDVSDYDTRILVEESVAFAVIDTETEDLKVPTIDFSESEDIDEDILQESPCYLSDNQEAILSSSPVDQHKELPCEQILLEREHPFLLSEDTYQKSSSDQINQQQQQQQQELQQQQQSQWQSSYQMLGEGSNSNDEYMGRYWHKGTFSTTNDGNHIATSSVFYSSIKPKEKDASNLPHNSWGQRSHHHHQQQQSSWPSITPLTHLTHPLTPSLNRSTTSTNNAATHQHHQTKLIGKETVMVGSIPHRPVMNHKIEDEYNNQQPYVQSDTKCDSQLLIQEENKVTQHTNTIQNEESPNLKVNLEKDSQEAKQQPHIHISTLNIINNVASASDTPTSPPPYTFDSLPDSTSSTTMPTPKSPTYHNHVEKLQYPQVIPEWEPLGALATSYLTQEEIEKIKYLRQWIQQTKTYPDSSTSAGISTSSTHSSWLKTITDVELIRFLRARSGNMEAASLMILNHDEWRRSILGPDTFTREELNYYSTCALNREVYWAGEALDGCPTVIVRTALHVPGGCDMDVYTRFVVWLLEEGRRRYGVGTHRQLCVIVDRSSPLEGELDGGVKSLTTMIPLFRRLFTVLQDNYPEILSRAYIVPVNWLFGTIYSTASSMIDEKSRQKVTLIKESDKKLWWLSSFPAAMVPRTMGGQASYPTYQPKEFYCNASYSIDTRQYNYF